MSPGMRLLHLVPHIDDEASGPSYSVPRLSQSLSARGHEVELICLRAPPTLEGVRLSVYPQWRRFPRFAVSPALARALRRRAGEVDIVHNHSLWSMANVAAGWVVPGRHAKLVTSPRGTLSAWALANSASVKRALWPLQSRALRRADLLHATSEVERDEIRALGLGLPVAVIPNGIDIPMPPERSLDGPKTLLFLSRIHPKKGIDRLLQAWQVLAPEFTDWRLVIAGRGEPGHVDEVTGLATTLQLPRVEFPGAVYGAAKSQLYGAADLFVLPTHSENFGMVVAEALAHGCPAVVSTGAPWAGLQTQRCGWWVDLDQQSLAEVLSSAMALPQASRAAMGQRGRQWMQRDFSWESVSAQMADAYQWLLGRGPRPDFVDVTND